MIPVEFDTADTSTKWYAYSKGGWFRFSAFEGRGLRNLRDCLFRKNIYYEHRGEYEWRFEVYLTPKDPPIDIEVKNFMKVFASRELDPLEALAISGGP